MYRWSRLQSDMAAALNPMEGSLLTPAPPVSRKTFVIAGIVVTVHGLDEVPQCVARTACLWLLHPRLQTQECMGLLAAACLDNWNHHHQSQETGLIAVTFDQRNHGTREVDPLSNEAWRSGNQQHAQDMFSIYRVQFNYNSTAAANVF